MVWLDQKILACYQWVGEECQIMFGKNCYFLALVFTYAHGASALILLLYIVIILPGSELWLVYISPVLTTTDIDLWLSSKLWSVFVCVFLVTICIDLWLSSNNFLRWSKISKPQLFRSATFSRELW